MDEYLRPTPFIESEHPRVVAFARDAAAGAADDVERAVRLYVAVRDGVRYDPYTFRLTAETYRASEVLAARRSFCVPKAILLAAAARALSIPSRLGFADVKNHLSSRRLRQLMGSDVFVWHGFTELHLEGAWRKATPTFNRALCDRFGVPTLEFDGRSDALFHPFDASGRRYMAYLRYHGSFADFPIDRMLAAIQAAYPAIFGAAGPAPSAPLDAEDDTYQA